MKKLIALSLILLPLISFAQKGEKNGVEAFFKKYSEFNGYSSVEVTEDMFEMFTDMEEGDEEVIEFLSKLKFVRYLEYEGSGLVTGISVVTPVVKGTSNVQSQYFVDGKAITTVTSKGKGKKKKSGTSTGVTVEGSEIVSSPVVGGVKTPVKEGVAVQSTGSIKASNITPISSVGNSVVYTRALDEINFAGYKQLMKANQDGEKMVFMKRAWTSSPNDTEFLLIQGNTMINIRGDINITHLYELEEILDLVGEILPL